MYYMQLASGFLTDVLQQIASNPATLIVVLVQFLLGVGLGYVSVKALKYVLAFIALLVLGSLLSIWSLSISPEELLKTLGITVEAVKRLATLLGLLTIGPVSLGFIIGVLIGLFRK
ncbi:MAG: hypothetical protein ACP5KA_03210 [Desulfurococcaceae archaeon]